jgi:hypothetical protein
MNATFKALKGGPWRGRGLGSFLFGLTVPHIQRQFLVVAQPSETCLP